MFKLAVMGTGQQKEKIWPADMGIVLGWYKIEVFAVCCFEIGGKVFITTCSLHSFSLQ